MNLKAVSQLTIAPLTGFWFRAINFRHYATRLATTHSTTIPTRFSPASPENPGFRVIYLAENHQVAAYEIGAMVGSPTQPISDPRGSWLFLSLQVRLHKVADFCDSSQIRLLGSSDQEFTGNWFNDPGNAPTQTLGVAMYRSRRFEGFLCPSAKVPGKNLVIFPDRLHRNSFVTFRNDLTGDDEQLT